MSDHSVETALSSISTGLEIIPSLQTDFDFLVSLKGWIGKTGLWLALAYVPDRFILSSSSWSQYISCVPSAHTGKTLEDIAASVLRDINNEVVPRWVRICITTRLNYSGVEGGMRHDVLVEDHQPKWSNPVLLERFSPSLLLAPETELQTQPLWNVSRY